MPPPSGARTLKRVKSNILIRADPTHSRSNSQTDVTAPTGKSTGASSQPTTTLLDPSTVPTATPQIARTRSVFTIATTDGHVLEFDPLMNSPSDLEALEGITNIALAAVAKRLAFPVERSDILSKLQEGKDADGNPMGVAELTAEAMTMLIAGSDTFSK